MYYTMTTAPRDEKCEMCRGGHLRYLESWHANDGKIHHRFYHHLGRERFENCEDQERSA